jgi:hypothetical protein
VSRTQYLRYQVIGAAIRGEHVVPEHGILRARLQSALHGRSQEAPRERQPARSLTHWLAGAGIAASVAAVALLGLRLTNVAPVTSGFLAGGETLEEHLELVEPPSYVVPIRTEEARIVTPQIRLTGLQYLVHHGGFASSLSRTVVHTNVVASSDDAFVAEDEVRGQ